MSDQLRVHQTAVLEEIRMRSSALSAAEQRVSRFVLSNPARVMQISVSDLAAASETSVGTVVRFCQRLGLRGYQDLKLSIAREVAPDSTHLPEEVKIDDCAEDILRKVLHSSGSALIGSSSSISAVETEAIVDTLIRARRIVFAAVGTSAPMAADIAYRLTTLGLDATFNPDTHVQHVTARMLTPDDVCFAVSHTGSTVETLTTMRAAAAAGATTVAVTSFVSSPLTDIVSHRLVAGSKETSYRVEAMASRIVHLAVLDALYVTITLRHEPARHAVEMAGDVITEHRI